MVDGRISKKHLVNCDTCFRSMYPIGSMHSTFTYIYHRNQPNLGKYISPIKTYGYGDSTSRFFEKEAMVDGCDVEKD